MCVTQTGTRRHGVNKEKLSSATMEPTPSDFVEVAEKGPTADIDRGKLDPIPEDFTEDVEERLEGIIAHKELIERTLSALNQQLDILQNQAEFVKLGDGVLNDQILSVLDEIAEKEQEVSRLEAEAMCLRKDIGDKGPPMPALYKGLLARCVDGWGWDFDDALTPPVPTQSECSSSSSCPPSIK